jgi:hypothetical protein
MKDFQQLARELRHHETASFGRGAGEAEISSAEEALGVRIGGHYRQFLLLLGWGGVESIEVFGLGSDVPPFLDQVAITRSERTEMQPALPKHLLPVASDGGGNHHCLDTAVRGEPPVVLWNHELAEDQVPELEAESFGAWIVEQLGLGLE